MSYTKLNKKTETLRISKEMAKVINKQDRGLKRFRRTDFMKAYPDITYPEHIFPHLIKIGALERIEGAVGKRYNFSDKIIITGDDCLAVIMAERARKNPVRKPIFEKVEINKEPKVRDCQNCDNLKICEYGATHVCKWFL